jgi:hypothetical protein
VARRNGVSHPQRGDAAVTRKANAFGKRPPCSRTSPPKQYAVSDGRDARGTVKLSGGVFTAVTIDGVIIGKFSTLKAAAASFGEARR